MIIWLNGAFGSGKTQTSYELERRIPNSHVYDPENIGYFINRNIPKEISKGDFQDYSIWRELNYTTLKYIDREYDGIIIVPMTLVNPQYFEEIVGKLRDDGVTVNHFVLWASKETLQKRLRSRGERKNSWGEKQIDRCMQGLSNDIFKHRIETDKLTVESVVETIASMLNIHLLEDKRNKFKKRLDRIKVQIKQMRFIN
ncbi:AAA family ATPase [Psychrobacillus psychrodurans]|uniref:AAA family ATPase n=1 Tax=Psychrobacillus psychrodurans TaxID=126157 RepID=UPI0008E6F847|nr:AAA family ATPase [Psychrobacillus psychrodurans]MCZ8540195.1 zeta toxin family protein [Psychrobacillus psychrodurans]SFM48100.1 AAA domain-containing protein [Psychrobacillus psychrodurans]